MAAADARSPPRSPQALEWVKAVGMPGVTLLVTLVGGYYFNDLLKDRESRESSERLYAQLLLQREAADANIRKEMLNLVINRFFAETKKGDLSAQVLQLELLANNFNQSIDLAPLFKELARHLSEEHEASKSQLAEMKKRLDVSAATLIFKQVASLGRRGFVKEVSLALGGWEERFGKPFLDERVPLSRLDPLATGSASQSTVRFQLEVIDVNLARREVEVRLRVYFPEGTGENVDRHFWVSPYDFPMLDNSQLSYGLRSSVVITEFFVPEQEDSVDNSVVKFHLVVFPAASASFKERQDYDDVLLDMVRSGGRASEGQRR